MFIDPNGILYAGEQRLGDRLATSEEVAAHQAAQAKRVAQTQIEAMEYAGAAPRWLREFFLTVSEGLAAQQGISPQQLAAANVAYARIKDLDSQIRELRRAL